MHGLRFFEERFSALRLLKVLRLGILCQLTRQLFVKGFDVKPLYGYRHSRSQFRSSLFRRIALDGIGSIRFAKSDSPKNSCGGVEELVAADYLPVFCFQE